MNEYIEPTNADRPKWCEKNQMTTEYCLLIKFRDVETKGRQVCGKCQHKKMNKYEYANTL